MIPSPPKNWWKSFFGASAGLVMWPRGAGRAEREAGIVVRRSRARSGARVLDLGCGVGRISLILAARGFDVVGLDYSVSYLREAKAKAKKLGLSDRARFVRGDMRQATRHVGRNGFDLVISLFNSFGYFARRADDRVVLRQVFRALKPGGAFVLNTLNEGGVLHRIKTPPRMGYEPMRNVFVIDHFDYDRRKRRTQGRWTIVDARGAKTEIARLGMGQNVYSHAELKRLLRAAGFRIERVWGMWDGSRFTPTTWHQTIVARKPRAASA